MSIPSEAGKSEAGRPSQRHSDVRQAGITLVQQLCEPLDTIENYLEAVICLHKADTPAARITLGKVREKSLAQVARVNEILRQLRDLLRHERGN